MNFDENSKKQKLKNRNEETRMEKQKLRISLLKMKPALIFTN